MKRIVVVLFAAVGVLGSIFASGVVDAGGGGHYVCGTNAAPVSKASGGGLEVSVTDNCFGPVVTRVPPGASVTWVNKGTQVHNIANVTKPTEQPSMLHSGARLTMTFNEPGAFIYHCSIHPGMMGVLFIGDDASQDVNAEVVASRTSGTVMPPKASSPSDPSVVEVRASSDSGGMAVQTVLLLALMVGIVAGGGSTLLVRLLDRRDSNQPSP
jgi:plastocyanin